MIATSATPQKKGGKKSTFMCEILALTERVE